MQTVRPWTLESDIVSSMNITLENDLFDNDCMQSFNSSPDV